MSVSPVEARGGYQVPEPQMVISCPTRVLGTKLKSCARAVAPAAPSPSAFNNRQWEAEHGSTCTIKALGSRRQYVLKGVASQHVLASFHKLDAGQDHLGRKNLN